MIELAVIIGGAVILFIAVLWFVRKIDRYLAEAWEGDYDYTPEGRGQVPKDPPPRSRENGFTLIQLMIMISVVGIMAGTLVSLYAPSQEVARQEEYKAPLTTPIRWIDKEFGVVCYHFGTTSCVYVGKGSL